MRAAQTLRDRVGGGLEFLASDGNWYPIEQAGMAHFPVDAVTFWNTRDRSSGPRSPFVRQWMLDPASYVFDWFGLNGQSSAVLGQTPGGRYLPTAPLLGPEAPPPAPPP